MAATTSPASRILAICSGVLICTMVPGPFSTGGIRWFDGDGGHPQRYGGLRPPPRTARPRLPLGTAAGPVRLLVAPQRFERATGDLGDRSQGRDRHHEALGLVVVDDRLGLRVVDLQARAHGLLGVVVALVQLAAAAVADALLRRRAVAHVEDVAGVFAADAPARD